MEEQEGQGSGHRVQGRALHQATRNHEGLGRSLGFILSAVRPA